MDRNVGIRHAGERLLVGLVLGLLGGVPLAASEPPGAATAPLALPPVAAVEPAPPTDCPCSPEKTKQLQAAAASAYKGVFYDNNFSYLNDPCYDDWHLGEGLKQLKIGDQSTLDVGGEYRARYHHEHNMRGLGLTGRSDDFLLQRTRVYLNAQIDEHFRVYAEYLDAASDGENFPSRPIEVNRSDFLNLFGDALLFDNPHGKLTGRVGRQELLYGSQRLVSPLDWANTRRTFDGAKLMWQLDDWKVDAFWTRPVIVNPVQFDQPDYQQEFYGVWSTYTGCKDHVYDFYWLGYHDYDSPYAAADDFVFQTVGGRWERTQGPWLGLLEGAYQFGEFGDLDHSAGFFTLGAGHRFEDAAWEPVLWAYYDWASGDDTLGNGFNQLFPLGHKYLGFMDFFGRTNIQDFNLALTLKPHEKWQFLAWWHVFYLQNGDDVPYNVAGRPIVDTPGGSKYLGQELDFLLSYSMSARAEWVFGYSHFFTGDWYRTNPVASTRFNGDADFFYTQFSLRF